MQDKQKVTLYLPPELHRQLKIRAAVDAETMTEIAQKAIEFYLNYPEVVEQCEAIHGQAHRVYSCPDCSSPVALREGEMVSLRDGQLGVAKEGDVAIGAPRIASVGANSQGEGELVPC